MAEANRPVVYASNEEKLKRYKRRVHWATEAHRKIHDEIRRDIEYYRLNSEVFTEGGHTIRSPKAVENIDAVYAALTAFEVSPFVAPKGMTSRDQTMVMTQALKNEADEEEVVPRTRRCIKEALFGIGYAKVGYEYQEETREVELDEPVYDEESGETFTHEEVDEVVLDHVTVDHVAWDDVLFDPEAKKWEDVLWVDQRIELPFEQVMDDPRYTAAAKKGLKPTKTIAKELREHPEADPDPDEQRIELHLMYDLQAGTVCTFTLAHDKILDEAPIPFAVFPRIRHRNPFVPLVTREDIGAVFGITDAKVQRYSIDETNILHTNLTNYVDQNKVKVLTKQGALTTQGQNALKSQDFFGVVELDEGFEVADIKTLDIPQMPKEAWELAGQVDMDAKAALGINELDQGQFPTGRKTATLTNTVAQSGTIRKAEKNNVLTEFYKGIFWRMLVLMQMFYDQPRITRMVEDMGDVQWVWDNEDIVTDVAVTVDIEPRSLPDTETKYQQGVALWNMAGADPIVDPVESRRIALQLMGFDAETIRAILKDPQQAEEETQRQIQQTQELAAAEAAGQATGPPGALSGQPLSGA